MLEAERRHAPVAGLDLFDGGTEARLGSLPASELDEGVDESRGVYPGFLGGKGHGGVRARESYVRLQDLVDPRGSSPPGGVPPGAQTFDPAFQPFQRRLVFGPFEVASRM